MESVCREMTTDCDSVLKMVKAEQASEGDWVGMILELSEN